ncbi:glycoside hydrolase family 9 protein [Dawidia soli]|uniref:Endoglucanase n=1 Tax=Dawidia soli TaxID=2782352 RepID=A0AAP2D728_9BACT|nr:glycoside hydrolase family 9 protein [Dawidia soli]MBT1685781.1 glycoside hydrolase family 9 protein [Dawidia soli]
MIRMNVIFKLLLLFATPILAQTSEDPGYTVSPAIGLPDTGDQNIRLNQMGFYPAAPKVAIVVTSKPVASFYIVRLRDEAKVFESSLAATRPTELSKEPTRAADFTTFQTPGTYRLIVPGVGTSYAFTIAADVHRSLTRAVWKGFYYQRASIALPERYAKAWHRPAGHPDDSVVVHPSAASPARPAGTVIRSPRGWYDAGDYNKYIVNSGITMGTLLSAYEDYAALLDILALDIPEQANTLPDALDEILWNLRWMLTMQDPGDGGVYHKLTNAKFDGMIMPGAAHAPRYVVQKGTAATLDFAAVMAQASRVLRPFKQLPGLADSCLQAAEQAWQWAQQHPREIYDQAAINNRFDPDITTGGYGDRDLTDEFIWAAAELYTTTQQLEYIQLTRLFPDRKNPLPSWGQVRLLGYYTLARHAQRLPAYPGKENVNARIIKLADELLRNYDHRSYRMVMGATAKDYIWGSSSVAANQGIALIQAYRLTQDQKYIAAALSNLDYLLGRNSTGYCFVTGFGSHSTQHPHHRPSIADGIRPPVPGLLAGGPNPGKQDKADGCTYGPGTEAPDKAYLDHDCSYASNEIAINWNAPLAYLAVALEAYYAGEKK